MQPPRASARSAAWIRARDAGARLPFRALVAGCGVVLALGLTGARAMILADTLQGLALPRAIALLLGALWQDWLLCAGLLALALGWQRWRGPAVGSLAANAVFLGLCTLFFLWGLGNIPAVRMLGEPVTRQWLSYSDILDSNYLLTLLADQVTLARLAAAVGVILAFNAACIAVALALAGLSDTGRQRLTHTVPLTLALLLGLVAGARLAGGDAAVSRGKTANAALAFAASLVSRGQLPGDLLQPDDPALTAEPFLSRAQPVLRPIVPRGQIRNVVFFVLESTAARFADGFGGSYGATPNLQRYAAMGQRFTTTYAHAPASNYSLVALTAAIVPELSPRSMTENRPGLTLVSIADVLRAQGMRTGFFSSSDKRFQNTDGYLRRAGFDTALDNTDWPCRLGSYGDDAASANKLGTANDRCTVPPMLEWIDKDREKPFFAVLWTGMQHYPYYPGGAAQHFVDDPDLNRYLNALREGDAALGQLMQALDDRKLRDSTLVVVLGDHGEAFGEHGQYVHASALYEENLRVPLLLINPVLFKGASADSIAGLSDIAPTVLDLMGLPAPAAWQGRSLFATDRPDGVLFFAPWNGFQIGFREGSRKYIRNGHTGEELLFDLAQDPTERNNLAPQQPQAVAAARGVLGRWIAAQNAWTKALLAGGTVAPPVSAAAAPRAVVILATGTRYLTAPRARISLDGVPLGEVVAEAAPGNADTAATDDQIAASVAPLRLPVPADACARRLEVRFLNDEWQGEGKTGDTNFSVQKIELDGKDYWPSQFSAATDDAGGIWNGYYTLFSDGSFFLDLDIPPDCLSRDLGRP